MSTDTVTRDSARDQSLILQADRFIIATNRGPVEYYITQNDELKFRRGSGGVVTALSDTVNSVNSTWVALAMTEGDRRALKSAHDGLLESPVRNMQVHLHYVEVPRRVYHRHYDIISNRVLWFIQHYQWEQAGGTVTPRQLQDAWENGYTRVNQALADAICTEVEREASKAIVMLHDYHLYLVAAMVRARHPDIIIQQFIHIPWPDIRYWASALPTEITRDIFTGLLGNDILGFQTRNDANNFLEGIRTMFESENAQVDTENREIECHGHRTLVRDYPISISVTEERKVVRSRPAQRALEALKPVLNEHNIMRVDRIDPMKNTVKGFEAYETLLEEHPELRENTTFLAFLIPSRQSLDLYRQYRKETMAIIDRINKKYGTADWKPVQAFVQNDRVMALTAMQYYDILLVNSLLDGMNLVAKEGVALNKKGGVLVLSRTSGAFQQLEEASIPISPADSNETTAALYKGLTMPREERQRLAKLAKEEVERDNLHTWIAQQVQDMNGILTTR